MGQTSIFQKQYIFTGLLDGSIEPVVIWCTTGNNVTFHIISIASQEKAKIHVLEKNIELLAGNMELLYHTKLGPMVTKQD